MNSANYDIWGLAGQSNMEGVGELSRALPPDERVRAFTSAGRWETAQDPLHWFWESFTPVHQALRRPGLPPEKRAWSDAQLAAEERQTRRYGAGLGLAFGKAMADATGRTIGLIPAAHGGTSLEQWSAAGKYEGGRSLYGAMLERIARAGGRLQGVLWYQGESDGAGGPEAAMTYGDRFAAWVAALRADTGRPDLPVLTVQIGCTTLPWEQHVSSWESVRHQQAALPARVPRLAVTSALDLGLVDPIHIDAVGLQRLGRRMARQALAITQDDAARLGPRVLRVEAVPSTAAQGTVRVVCQGVAGGWTPADHMAGFVHLSATGEPLPLNPVFNAFPDPDYPTAILVRLNLPVEPGERIAYGAGLNPYVNVVDAADMPLCAFSLPVDGAV